MIHAPELLHNTSQESLPAPGSFVPVADGSESP